MVAQDLVEQGLVVALPGLEPLDQHAIVQRSDFHQQSPIINKKKLIF